MNPHVFTPRPNGVAITTRMIRLYRIHLDRSRIELLYRAATDRLPTPKISVGSVLNGTHFTNRTLLGLLTDLEASIECHDPGLLDNLDIECRHDYRTIRVQLETHGATIAVTDVDSAWVTGKVDQLRQILVAAGGVDRPLRMGRWSCSLAAVGAALGAGAAAHMIVDGGPPNLARSALLAGCVLLAGFAGYALGCRRERTVQTQLYVAEPPPLGRWWVRVTLIEKLMTASVLIAFLALVTRSLGA